MQKSSDYSILNMRIYSRHEAIIRRLVCKGIDIDDAPDLATEIIIKAVDAVEKLRDPSKLEAWLMTITDNSVKRFYKEKSKIRQNEITRAIDNETGEEIYIVEILADKESVEDIIKCAEERHALGGLLNWLNEKERSIFLMRNFYCYKFKEISKRLRMNENTVKSINARCCKKMKTRWEELFSEENF